MMERYVMRQIKDNFERKMVFVGGLRQVGKTTWFYLGLVRLQIGRYPLRKAGVVQSLEILPLRAGHPRR